MLRDQKGQDFALKILPHPRIDAAFGAFTNACVRLWLMPGGPLGDGPVDHFPVSEDLFLAAFQSVPAHIIEGFPRNYTGLRQIVRYVSDESPPGWKRLTSGSRRASLGFLLVAAMSEGKAADLTFHARLAQELEGDRRAADLQADLKWLWTELDEWVASERDSPGSEFHAIRPLVLSSYAESMSRIGETVEMAFPNRKDRQTLEPAIRRLADEPDPSVATIVSELAKLRRADPPLQRAMRDFQTDPFRCTGIAGCLKAFLIQRLTEGAARHASGSADDTPVDVELLFYRSDDGLLVPYLVAASERSGYLASVYLPDKWGYCRQVGDADVQSSNLASLGIRLEVVRAIERGSLGLKQMDGNWFSSAGRVSADAQDAILIRNPPEDLLGCSRGFLHGWNQWYKRDNSSVKGLTALHKQVGLLCPEWNINFTGGVRIAHTGQYLRVPGFGPRAASSNAAWWSAHPTGSTALTVIPGQELDARDLTDGTWDCQCFDALGKLLGNCSASFTTQPPLRCAFPIIGERDRVETAHPESDAFDHATYFLRVPAAGTTALQPVAFEPINDQGRCYFGAAHQTVVVDHSGSATASQLLAPLRIARDDLLRVLIGRSCDRVTPVGWGAFADDLQLVMNRANPENGKWTFRHAGAIVRAWEESGFVDIINRPWAGLCVVPRTPRWTIVDLGDGVWRAVATGLIGPQQRDLLLDRLIGGGPATGSARLKHAINPYVPSVVQVDGKGSTERIEMIARDVGLAPAERISRSSVGAALSAPQGIQVLASDLLAADLDRGRFAEDADQRDPMTIGDVSIQRTRAAGYESRWLLRDGRLRPGQGMATTSRNWAYLLARQQSRLGIPLHGVGGIAIPLKSGLPDSFLPICVGRAMTLCGSCLPGPFTKGIDRFYGMPMNTENLNVVLRILR